MSPLIFCKDGVLRLKEWLYDSKTKQGQYIYLPLKITQELDKNKFLKHLGSHVEFEPELTVKEFFSNLAPWCEILEGIACMDFESFLQEVNTPCADLETNVSHVEIVPYITFSPVADFEGDMEFKDAENGLSEIIMPPTKVTNKIEMEVQWSYTAWLIEPEDREYGGKVTNVSLDYTPINRWAHLPIKFGSNFYVRDDTANSDYMEYKDSLFNQQHPLVEKQDRFSKINI